MTNTFTRHDPSSTAFRVCVIRKTDSVGIGSMPAAVGMVLVDGTRVTKVNAKSILVQYPGCGAFRETKLVSVFLDEATRHGFKREGK